MPAIRDAPQLALEMPKMNGVEAHQDGELSSVGLLAGLKSLPFAPAPALFIIRMMSDGSFDTIVCVALSTSTAVMTRPE